MGMPASLPTGPATYPFHILHLKNNYFFDNLNLGAPFRRRNDAMGAAIIRPACAHRTTLSRHTHSAS